MAFIMGCGPSLRGSFSSTGFAHSDYPYRVVSPSPPGYQILGPEWRLDNYYLRRGKLEAKKGADYESDYYVDVNRDGKADDLGEFHTYDLRYVHKRTAGVIWLRTIPLPVSASEKELRVLARDYVDEITGTHYETVQLKGYVVHINKERAYAVDIVESAGGTVARRPAHAVTVEVASVEQLKLSPDRRQTRVRLVLIRPGFTFKRRTAGGRGAKLPVLMLAGYANHVDDYQASLADFERFLGQIEIQAMRGVDLTPVEAAPSKDEPASSDTSQAVPPPTEVPDQPGPTSAPQ